MTKQITNTILMVEPIAFSSNEQTSKDNHYQNKSNELPETIQQKALIEFNNLVSTLEKVGIKVIRIKDNLKPLTPDSIFPNNWISFHQNGTVCMYPMLAKNRRAERREDVLEIVENNGFKIDNVIDYSNAELENVFLEGTGSMILDHVNQIAYCSISQRANEDLFFEFCEDVEYTPIVFHAFQTVNDKRIAIYHTNVMMCVGKDFAIICLDAIDNKKERKYVSKVLTDSGKKVITITQDQVNNFAGNMLQVQGKDKDYLVMSTSAFNSLSKAQISLIENYTNILHSNVSTIEQNGGGSVRCMMAEVFLSTK